MTLSRWKTRSRSLLFKNPWWSYFRDETELPDGSAGEYHLVHTNGSSCIVPVLPDGRLVLVNQYRYLRDRESIEFPCGGVKEGRTFDDTAEQELAEEAGYRAQQWAIAGEFNPYNGVTDEMCRVYIAKRLTPIIVPHDATEEFERLTLTPDELEARILSGVIWDGMTIAAWTLAKPHI